MVPGDAVCYLWTARLTFAVRVCCPSWPGRRMRRGASASVDCGIDPQPAIWACHSDLGFYLHRPPFGADVLWPAQTLCGLTRQGLSAGALEAAYFNLNLKLLLLLLLLVLHLLFLLLLLLLLLL